MSSPLQASAFNLINEQQKYKNSQKSALDVNPLDLLRQHIRFLLKSGYPSIEQFATVVGMSPRSLQRHLAKNHLSYSLLIEQVRFETAVSLLKDSPCKVIEISLELGYDDAASFTRAFKRWTGISPSQFRHSMSAFEPQV